MTTQPERIPLDDLTSDQLDQLYADLDAAQDRLEHHERTTLPNLHRRIEADADTIRRWRGRAESAETRIRVLEQRVAELTAGQCTHALAVCEQHHRVPVTGCPYPRCKAAAARTT